MGGAKERIEIVMINDLNKDPAAAHMHLKEHFEGFDAAKAQCFKKQDREKLLAIIEAGFGDFQEFNKDVREVVVTAGGRLVSRPAPFAPGGMLSESGGERTENR